MAKQAVSALLVDVLVDGGVERAGVPASPGSQIRRGFVPTLSEFARAMRRRLRLAPAFNCLETRSQLEPSTELAW